MDGGYSKKRTKSDGYLKKNKLQMEWQGLEL